MLILVTPRPVILKPVGHPTAGRSVGFSKSAIRIRYSWNAVWGTGCDEAEISEEKRLFSE